MCKEKFQWSVHHTSNYIVHQGTNDCMCRENVSDYIVHHGTNDCIYRPRTATASLFGAVVTPARSLTFTTN